MRYLLDTNILVFVLSGNRDKISRDVLAILDDCTNQFYVSSISLLEIAQLHRLDKIESGKKKRYAIKSFDDIIDFFNSEFYLEVLPFAEEHAQTLGKLKVTDGHNDPFDHAIIAHAITNDIPLISSDKKFDFYQEQGLDFVKNKR